MRLEFLLQSGNKMLIEGSGKLFPPLPDPNTQPYGAFTKNSWFEPQIIQDLLRQLDQQRYRNPINLESLLNYPEENFCS